MNAFTMWEERIVFLNGWFVYMDGKGNNSIISQERARMLELGYQRYQASMDVNRGGAPYELAYPSRGFTREGNEYVYKIFRVDQLIVGKVNPIPNILQIPRSIGNVKINSISREAFKSELAIEKVVLHDDIHTIGESAFEGCKNLNDINLSNKNIEIKKDAFKDTSLFSKEVSYLNNVLVRVETTFKGVLKVQDGTLGIADEALCDCTEIPIGTNTIECIRSGIVLGNAAMLDGMADKLQRDLGKEIKTLVATGGLAREIIACCDKDIIFNKDLVLQGLLSIYRKNR